MVEGAGALSVAALPKVHGRRRLAVISGGNVDIGQLSALVLGQRSVHRTDILTARSPTAQLRCCPPPEPGRIPGFRGVWLPETQGRGKMESLPDARNNVALKNIGVLCILIIVLGCQDDTAGQGGDLGLAHSGGRDASIGLDALSIAQRDSMTTHILSDAHVSDRGAMDAEVESDGMICGSATARALGSKRPVDVLWVIDSSPVWMMRLRPSKAT